MQCREHKEMSQGHYLERLCVGSSWKWLRQSFIVWTDFHFRTVTGNMLDGPDGGRNRKLKDELGNGCRSPSKV